MEGFDIMSNKKYRKLVSSSLILGLSLSFVSGITTDAACPKLNKSKVTLEKGGCCTLKVKSKKGNVTWCSSKKKVATVNNKGKITAKNSGTTTITAKTGGKKLSCKVTVCKKDGTKQSCAQSDCGKTTACAPSVTCITPSTCNTSAACDSADTCSNTAYNNIANIKSLQGYDITNVLKSYIKNADNQITPISLPTETSVPQAVSEAKPAAPANNSEISEESAYQILNSFRTSYPEGMPLTNSYYYYSPVFGHGYGCYGFAAMLSDSIFGTTKKYTTHTNFEGIRVGDNIRVGGSHSVVCLTKGDGYITVVEGNYNSSVHWDRKITKSSLSSSGFVVYTRY